MFRETAGDPITDHVTEADLMLDLDGELSQDRREQVRRHLASCWQCRTQQQQLHEGVAAFTNLYREGMERPLPPADVARRMLRAQMAEAAREAKPARFWLFQGSGLAAAGAVAAALLLGVFWLGRDTGRQANVAASSRDLLRPNHLLSPGQAAAISRDRVCGLQGVEGSRLNADLAQQVFARYHIVRPAYGAYEIDYVVPPALGGVQSVENLWPQPYQDGAWNSHTKDALEEHLEELVCSGQMGLEQAQVALSSDWIGAYEEYFRSRKPLLSHVAFAKDRPWPFSTRVSSN